MKKIRRYLKLFDKKINFIESKDEVLGVPYVAYINEVSGCVFSDMEYEIIKPYDQQYFTVKAIEDGVVVINELPSSCEYLKTQRNYGEWSEMRQPQAYISLKKGEVLSISCVSKIMPLSFISFGNKMEIYGNIMSLLFGDDFIGKTSLEGYDDCLSYVFSDNSDLISAKNLILPATTLAGSCYYGMFKGCTSLVEAPELPATVLANNCYQYMFQDCSSLIYVPELPATTLANNCYLQMFNGCSSLVNAPELSATTLAEYCYAGMFGGCTSLVEAPELPATTLANGCYYGMFNGCSSLVNAPKLPSTELASGCYYSMFNGCTSLVEAPELPSTTLVSSCYANMFQGCTNLNKVTMLATDISATDCLNDWLSGVSETGTFVKESGVSIPSGPSGIPEGWNAVAFGCDKYFTIEALESGSVSFTSKLTGSKYSVNDSEWVEITGPLTFGVSENDTVRLSSVSSSMSSNPFSVSCKYEVYGNIMSLLFGDDFVGKTSLEGYDKCFKGMFIFDSTLVSAMRLILPATTLANNCYGSMFAGCMDLVNAPELPATTLANDCYQIMFGRCSSLVNAPELPATTLATNCYREMFVSCSSLVNAPELPATTLASYCYYCMFAGCASLVEAPELPATTLADGCCYSMFNGCTSLVEAPKLPATTLAESCYNSMFAECTSLVSTPELPATTLAWDCYNAMFNGCTSLVNTSVLPATTLVGSCYEYMFAACTSLVKAPILLGEQISNVYCAYMFADCTKLNYVKTFAKSFSVTNFLSNVSPTGTLVKLAGVKMPQSGVYPSGWSLEFMDKQIVEPFTIQTIEDANVNINVPSNFLSLKYSLNDSEWVEITNNTSLQVLANDTVKMYCEINPSKSYNTVQINVDAKYNISGNIMSLIYGDKMLYTEGFGGITSQLNALFSGQVNLISAENLLLPEKVLISNCYQFMFGDCTSLEYAPILPATTLANGCYGSMFSGCIALVNAPELPATALATNCYQYMFQDCTSLVNAPALPATTLATNCYQYMFQGCTSIVDAPSLPAEVLKSYSYSSMFKGCTSLVNAPTLSSNSLSYSCYSNMFEGCTSLVSAPELPATTLAKYCYSKMFKGCTSLVNTPSLQVTTLENNCYEGMFQDCTSLVEAPELPATTLADRCYYHMFNGCSSLVEAPELPATTLTDFCYYHMFANCTNLNKVTILATKISATNCLTNWLLNVAESGEIMKEKSVTLEVGPSGIPEGWEFVKHLDEKHFTIEAIEEGSVSITPPVSYEYFKYSLNEGEWVDINEPVTIQVVEGDKIQLSCVCSRISPDSCGFVSMFNITNKFNVYSNAMSLLYGDDFNGKSTLYTECFYGLFANCTTLISAKNLTLPSAALSNYCYAGMFINCTSLVEVPELPATTLADNCYYCMFSGCESLVSAPELPAKSMKTRCYGNMFYGCTSLVNAPELPATTLAAEYCYQYMFGGCTSLVNAPVLQAQILSNYCYYFMFDGCTNLTNVKIYAYMSRIGSFDGWLNNVSSSGVIYVKYELGSSLNVPTGWAVAKF